MRAPKNRGYKRSWKNLLLNTRYQLRFTLFMVALCAVVMVLLGRQVLQAADKATTVSIDNVLGVSCQPPEAASAATVVVDDALQEPVPALDEQGGRPPEGDRDGDDIAPEPASEAAVPAAEGDAEPAAEGDAAVRTDAVVEIDDATMEAIVPAGPTLRYHLCRIQQNSTIQRLRAGQARILWVLISAGVLLCLGLAVYGIKMTHRVAGPLHKVTLYLRKLKQGQYDRIYSLRKGDQLVDFYEHFKEAHEGMRKVELEDADVLRELIAEAEAAGVAGKSPELKQALDELRVILDAKEAARE